MPRKKSTTNESTAMDQLLASAGSAIIPAAGGTVNGTVISVGKREVRLDIPGFTTGVVRGRELFDESGEFSNIKIGDKVSAIVLELENENGELELSLRQAGHQKAWGRFEDLKKQGEIVKVRVVDANKGGLMVKLGEVPGFLPVSQLAVEHYPRVEGGDKNKILELLKQFIGQMFEVKIITVDEVEEKLIVSERAAWEQQQKGKLDNLHVGDVVEGKISGVVDFGCFVEFGEGLEGLVHISELAWQRVDKPQDLVQVGQPTKAKIINIDGSKISLSFRRLQEDPWKNAGEKYKVGDTIKGKIIKINPFGLFVELDQDIHALCHVSEISEKTVRDPNELFKLGDSVEFKIISMDAKEHRLGLSIKALTAKPDEETKSNDQESKKISKISADKSEGDSQVE